MIFIFVEKFKGHPKNESISIMLEWSVVNFYILFAQYRVGELNANVLCHLDLAPTRGPYKYKQTRFVTFISPNFFVKGEESNKIFGFCTINLFSVRQTSFLGQQYSKVQLILSLKKDAHK